MPEELSESHEFDWNTELGQEKRFPTNYKYVLGVDNAADFVFSAILRMLTSDKYYRQWLSDFVRGSNDLIPDEETEERVRSELDQSRASADIFPRALEEALRYKSLAQQAIAESKPFKAHFNYWSPAQLPIKGGVELDPMREYPGFLLATTQLPKVDQLAGFPAIILERYIGKDSRVDYLDIIDRTAALSGNTLQSVLQKLFDNQGAPVFLAAMDSVGRYSNLDRVKAGFISSGRERDGRFSLRETFSRFTEEERRFVQKPTAKEFWVELDNTINAGGESGRLHIDYYTEGYVWHDPISDSIEGKITPSETDHINVYVASVVTPDTTHERLLGVRREAQDVVRNLGIPSPRRILSW